MCGQTALVMQEWYEAYQDNVKRSCNDKKMKVLYVDDGRGKVRKLKRGMRFNPEKKKIGFKDKWLEEDSCQAQLNPAQLRWSLLSSSDHPPTHLVKVSKFTATHIYCTIQLIINRRTIHHLY